MKSDTCAQSDLSQKTTGFCGKKDLLCVSCRVMDLIIKPRLVWEEVRNEEVSLRDLYFRFTALVLILPWISWLVGKCFVGERVLFAGVVRWPFLRALFVGLFLYLLCLALIYALSWIAKGLAVLLGFDLNISKASRLTSYALVPAMVGGVLLVVPGLEPVWGLLSLYGAFLLYQGGVAFDVPLDKRVPFFVGMLFGALIFFGLLSVMIGRFTPPVLPKILEQAIGHV